MCPEVSASKRTVIKKITADDITIGDWAAIDAMMAQQMHDRFFEETVFDMTVKF